MINSNKSMSHLLSILLCVSFLQPVTALAKTTRVANVHVQNLTGLEIESVSVVHKYSNVFKEKGDWGRLPNGAMTTRPLKVRYNTGVFTTGRDWWLVTWKYKGNNSVRYTSPNNFRGIIDFVERMHIVPFEVVSSSLNQTPALSELAKTPAARLAGGLMNTGSTQGFKRHFLKSEDQENGLIITISHNSVAFDSSSGHSSTEGIRSKRLPPPVPTTTQQQGPRVQTATVNPKACEQALQNKIAWNYQGSKSWHPSNIKSLCGNVKVNAPAVCFNKVMHGGVNWGGGTQWKYQNAMNLCKKSQNAPRTISCFQRFIKNNKGQWQRAINACQAK